MVATTTSYTDLRYRTQQGDAFDGVVRVNFGGYYGTGTLLFDGRAVLTAAHLFEGRTGTASVTFETESGLQTRTSLRILTHPGHDSNSNNDLAIVWLSGAAPMSVNRYDIYRSDDEIGQTFALVGYGLKGTGSTGVVNSDGAIPTKLKAANQFDADIGTLKSYLGAGLGWLPLAGTQLVADFDNGTTARDALGGLIYRKDTGLGLNEGLISPGDSGGPAFLGNKVAGVASYTASLSKRSFDSDIDDMPNSSFGEVAAWQRVSAYQQWIDQSLRQQYPDAPSRPEDVRRQVVEGDTWTNYAYFLVQFNGLRWDPDAIVSVDYATRDGTALAGQDYLAVSGRLNLYADETQAVIPVEILGDATPEPDEYFYLDVFNPVGGGFGEGVVKLTAVRTILDDDGWMG